MSQHFLQSLLIYLLQILDFSYYYELYEENCQKSGGNLNFRRIIINTETKFNDYCVNCSLKVSLAKFRCNNSLGYAVSGRKKTRSVTTMKLTVWQIQWIHLHIASVKVIQGSRNTKTLLMERHRLIIQILRKAFHPVWYTRYCQLAHQTVCTKKKKKKKMNTWHSIFTR